MKKFLNPKELSEYLRISKATIWRYVASGKLPQPKRLSKQILIWDLNEVNAKLGLTSEAEINQGGDNE